jgi:hypothetical protein
MLPRLKSWLIPAEDASAAAPGDAEIRALVRQVEGLMSDAFSVHRRLVNSLEGKPSLIKSLTNLFADPIATTEGKVAPYASIQPGVEVGFESTATVRLRSIPKENFRDSPDSCLNTLFLDFKEPSQWLTLEVGFSWEEIQGAKSYQLGLYGLANRPVTLRAALRFPRQGGQSSDHMFAVCSLPRGERALNASGALEITFPIDADRGRQPKLLLALDTSGDLNLRLDYLTAYFV